MSGKAVKRLDRLAPNLVPCLRIRLGMNIAKYNSPINTTGGISGVLLGHKFKSGKAAKRMDRLATKFGTLMWIHLGMDIG